MTTARRLCLDTNALIYFLDRVPPYYAEVERIFAGLRDSLKQAFVSVVTEIELLVQPIRYQREWELEQIRVVLDAPQVQVVELNRTIAHSAAEIRADLLLDLPDATIIATAMYTGCDAILGNDRRCAQRVRELPYVLLDDLVKEQGA